LMRLDGSEIRLRLPFAYREQFSAKTQANARSRELPVYSTKTATCRMVSAVGIEPTTL
jgi:hypothetical protein